MLLTAAAQEVQAREGFRGGGKPGKVELLRNTLRCGRESCMGTLAGTCRARAMDQGSGIGVEELVGAEKLLQTGGPEPWGLLSGCWA